MLGWTVSACLAKDDAKTDYACWHALCESVTESTTDLVPVRFVGWMLALADFVRLTGGVGEGQVLQHKRFQLPATTNKQPNRPLRDSVTGFGFLNRWCPFNNQCLPKSKNPSRNQQCREEKKAGRWSGDGAAMGMSVFIHADGIDMALMALGLTGAIGDGMSMPLRLLVACGIANDLGSGPDRLQQLSSRINAVRSLRASNPSVT